MATLLVSEEYIPFRIQPEIVLLCEFRLSAWGKIELAQERFQLLGVMDVKASLFGVVAL